MSSGGERLRVACLHPHTEMRSVRFHHERREQNAARTADSCLGFGQRGRGGGVLEAGKAARVWVFQTPTTSHHAILARARVSASVLPRHRPGVYKDFMHIIYFHKSTSALAFKV